MGKIREYIAIGLSLTAILLVGISLVREEKKEQEEELSKLMQIGEKYKNTEHFHQPMVWNGGSLQIGYLLKGAIVDIDSESEEISYSVYYDTQKAGLHNFDSLLIEICKHHCDSLTPHIYTNEYNRVFECSHPGASITLSYSGRNHEWKGEIVDESNIEIIYCIPQKIGHELGEEWQQYLVVE